MSLKIKAEVKIDSDPCVVAWDKILFVGCENGSIKSFEADLTPVCSWAAHGVQIFTLDASGGYVYSSSNDGGIRVWTTKGEKVTELSHIGGDFSTIHVFNNTVFAGDELGNVIIYENNEEKARYNVMEEVKGLWFSNSLLFTVRDLDVTVNEISPGVSKTRFITKHTMEGRAPLAISGNHLLVMARGGNNMILYDATLDTTFKKLNEVKVSDMIVTSLSVSGNIAWTGGWDTIIRRWYINEDKLVAAGELNLGACIYSLVATPQGTAYAVLAGGKVICVTST